MQPGFDVGDNAVYPVHGVAEIVDIEHQEIGGEAHSVYILKIIESGLKIMVPCNNVSTVGLRSVVAPAEVTKIFNILKSEAGTGDNQTWNRRYREYMDKIKTGSAFEIAEVLRDLALLRNQKELSFGERRMLDTAQRLLVSELALAQKETEATIIEQIDEVFTNTAA